MDKSCCGSKIKGIHNEKRFLPDKSSILSCGHLFYLFLILLLFLFLVPVLSFLAAFFLVFHFFFILNSHFHILFLVHLLFLWIISSLICDFFSFESFIQILEEELLESDSKLEEERERERELINNEEEIEKKENYARK